MGEHLDFIWKAQAVLTQFQVIFQHLPEGIEENHKNQP
jgi:hypothetical protein